MVIIDACGANSSADLRRRNSSKDEAGPRINSIASKWGFFFFELCTINYDEVI